MMHIRVMTQMNTVQKTKCYLLESVSIHSNIWVLKHSSCLCIKYVEKQKLIKTMRVYSLWYADIPLKQRKLQSQKDFFYQSPMC